MDTLWSLQPSWKDMTNTPEAKKSRQDIIKRKLGERISVTQRTPQSSRSISCKAESDRETLAWDTLESIPTDTLGDPG